VGCDTVRKKQSAHKGIRVKKTTPDMANKKTEKTGQEQRHCLPYSDTVFDTRSTLLAANFLLVT
jgi:hypothetical protein